MGFAMHKPIIAWICLTLLLVQSGCASLIPPRVAMPPSEDIRDGLGTIAVVAARFTPALDIQAPTRGKGHGAGKGAGRALGGFWSGCVDVGAMDDSGIGAMFVVVGCAILTPFVAIGGATHGAVKARPKAEVEEADTVIQSAVDEQAVQQVLQERVLAYAQTETSHTFVSLTDKGPNTPEEPSHYRELIPAGSDTVLEVSVLSVGAEGKGVDPPLTLTMNVRARLANVRDNNELYSETYTFHSDRRKFSTWAADDGQQVRDTFARAYTSLAQHIVDELFLLYPLATGAGTNTVDDAQKETQKKKRKKGSTSFLVSFFGLRPEYPGVRGPLTGDKLIGEWFEWTKVDSLQPTLRWEPFPRPQDREASGLDLRNRVYTVTYDLKISRGAPDFAKSRSMELIYERSGLTAPYHKLEQSLEPNRKYFWAIRARFELDGDPRRTEWGTTHYLGRKLANIPNHYSYRFKTPKEPLQIEAAR